MKRKIRIREGWLALASLILASFACVLPSKADVPATVESSVAGTVEAHQTQLNITIRDTLEAQETAHAATAVAYQRLLGEEAVKYQQTQAALMMQASTPPPDMGPTEHATPYYFAYATEIPFTGIEAFSVPAQDRVLMILELEEGVTVPIEFVEYLTFQFAVEEHEGSESSTLDFSMWNPTNGGWGINHGKNDIGFGESTIEIKYPDPYVGRTGRIVLDIRNFGQQEIVVSSLSITMGVRGVDGIGYVFGVDSE